jgi:outer membrane cobalamin receptor
MHSLYCRDRQIFLIPTSVQINRVGEAAVVPLEVAAPATVSGEPRANHAQDASTPPVELPEVVVGATRLPTPESELGTTATVITSDEIAAKQERMLPDALLDVPWVNK